MTGFIDKFKENFAVRLDGFALPVEAIGFARDPFAAVIGRDLSCTAKEVVASINESKFMLELVDIQSSLTMPQ